MATIDALAPSGTQPSEDDLTGKDIMRFHSARGSNLMTRNDAYLAWRSARTDAGLWPYFRRYTTDLRARATAVSARGRVTEGVNFGGQDYLSLSVHPDIHEAARKALADYGPLTAGSPALGGSTPVHQDLEHGLGQALERDQIILFPTGWAAGYGIIRALMHRGDHVLLDHLAHDSLRQGAGASGANVSYHKHLDATDARRRLADIRAHDTKGAILVVTEGVFSMDSDAPKLAELLATCREFDAHLLVDVAHDFAAMGPGGTGQPGLQGVLSEVDLLVGAFSKSFATTGGFMATSSASAAAYTRMFGGPQTFSSALTPIQAAIAAAALAIARSPEGDELRARVAKVAQDLRSGMTERGLTVLGDVVCPVVPVLAGSTAVGRIASGLLEEHGVIAHLVEQPAVPSDAARFRLQAMADHTAEDIRKAVDAVSTCINQANEANQAR
ncbi:aminotransferase class I/II-fold pyridoxal phosphate-dependent enzyme [Kitasatospora sp. NPDC048722]|uniref:aminotransferase class I/II-fold pyridoxal phosphate-dependent enzyme n=1 Tax=Kitasatospora sp. NPDC048722 TaxID=3155639 RepID=UPI00340688AD